jgi:hypothetical protein
VPTLRVVPADAGSEAGEIARRILEESPSHVAVELRMDDRLVLALRREAAPSAPRPDPDTGAEARG